MTLMSASRISNISKASKAGKQIKRIADLYKFDLVRCSFVPPKDFRQLRELARYRFQLVCMKSSEKNRIQNCMTVSNVGFAGMLSDPFGSTAAEILSYLLEHPARSIDEKAETCPQSQKSSHFHCKNNDGLHLPYDF